MSQSSHSEEDDVCYSPLDETLATDIKNWLLRCLNRVSYTGSFATFADIPQAANPGITIDGIGIVGLPLSERDAQVIVTKSHRAPFGKGSTTIVDTAIRKTWELNTDQFKLENPIWQETVEGITKRVAKELGVRTGIQAILYKMLLYEAGAMFKPHKEYIAYVDILSAANYLLIAPRRPRECSALWSSACRPSMKVDKFVSSMAPRKCFSIRPNRHVLDPPI